MTVLGGNIVYGIRVVGQRTVRVGAIYAIYDMIKMIGSRRGNTSLI